jgi:hypothetical protein
MTHRQGKVHRQDKAKLTGKARQGKAHRQGKAKQGSQARQGKAWLTG